MWRSPTWTSTSSSPCRTRRRGGRAPERACDAARCYEHRTAGAAVTIARNAGTALYGYARVSTADQNLDHQIDALVRAGVECERIFADTASGAKASRPQLDQVISLLRPGDTLKITRLDRLSRSVQHLINLGADLRARDISLHVIEQGIDTATMEGRAMFGILSVLAELQRELIVANTMDGLAAARSHGRVGGRRPKLTQRQLDQAQRMYDDGTHTVEGIAEAFHVSRPTLYRHLTAHHEGRDCALIVYRNTTKLDGSNRRLGETGASGQVQRDTDRKWWPIAASRRSHVKAIVYVSGGGPRPPASARSHTVQRSAPPCNAAGLAHPAVRRAAGAPGRVPSRPDRLRARWRRRGRVRCHNSSTASDLAFYAQRPCFYVSCTC
ncbi:recombinase family protein [Actinoallomurus sp. CA-150999]|uniref:recombinase family protein n=1 Tax=Actinoallomurus sp. CA-150999 TaxID=3239887 RepID=UPI003D8B3760